GAGYLFRESERRLRTSRTQPRWNLSFIGIIDGVGHQVNFYLDPADTRRVEAALRGLGPLQILHSRSTSPRPRLVDSLDLEELGQHWLYFHLVRPEDLDAVVMNHVPAQSYWAVDVTKSPVVEFN